MHESQTEDALRDFEGLAQLRGELATILNASAASLRPFYSPTTGGFVHRLKEPTTAPPSGWSKSSTATCVAFLRASGQLLEEPWSTKTSQLRQRIVASDWRSAGLPRNNPYTTAFLLEALDDLEAKDKLTAAKRAKVEGKVAGLRNATKAGGIALDGFEPTAFLTYKVVAALKRWNPQGIADEVERWNWNHLHKESALVAAASNDADVFEVAYSVLIANAIRPLDAMSPQQRQLLGFGLKQFFEVQRTDGTWPRSRPLFVYPKLGHAYCFEYELLSAMLAEPQLSRVLHQYLPALRAATHALDVRKYPLESTAGSQDASYGWASGHHGTDPSPESWSTAAVLHFCFGLSELIAGAIRRATFSYADASYTPPKAGPGSAPFFPQERFLDSVVRHNGKRQSLSKILTERLVEPLVVGRSALEVGRPLPKGSPTSAILYGPPGTSKTELAKLIAEALGWPLLALDPSHLTRRGLDRVHAEANTIFRMLEHSERIVVLLDEFDELVRERESAGQLESRFLTTAMLPKLAALSRERRLVYLVATNHLEQFDAAIRRPGRFFLIVPVMPPTTEAKLGRWPALASAVAAIKKTDPSAATKARESLRDLTFLEAQELASAISTITNVPDLFEAIDAAGNACTLRQPVRPEEEAKDGKRRWLEQIEGQRDRIRGI
jgi:hypothetical protein